MLTTPCLAVTLTHHPVVARLILPALLVSCPTAAVVLHLGYAILSMYQGHRQKQQWCEPRPVLINRISKASMRYESVGNAPGRCKLQAQGLPRRIGVPRLAEIVSTIDKVPVT